MRHAHDSHQRCESTLGAGAGFEHPAVMPEMDHGIAATLEGERTPPGFGPQRSAGGHGGRAHVGQHSGEGHQLVSIEPAAAARLEGDQIHRAGVGPIEKCGGLIGEPMGDQEVLIKWVAQPRFSVDVHLVTYEPVGRGRG